MKLNKTEELHFHAAISQSIADAVIGTDLQRRIISWNKGAEKMYGWKEKEVLGKFGKDVMKTIFLKPEDKEGWQEDLKTKGYWQGEVIQLRKDKKKINVLVSIAIVKDKEGKPIGGVGVNRDITDLKRLEQQKDEFLAVASHELKTPVTSIKAYTQVLENRFKKKGDVESASMLEKMEAQLNKLTNLISDLLDVTKIEAGKLQFHEGYFDFDELVKQIIEEVQLTTGTHKIIKKGSVKKKVYGDRERIGQVFTNLLSNAVKYSPDSEKVIVHTYVEAKEVQICVEDFGVGIAPEEQSLVFDRFYRGSGKKSSTFPGLGLGLYISADIIKRQGGEMWVKSALEKGSTFCFSLPIRKRVK